MTTAYPFYDQEWLDKTGLSNSAIDTPAGWELYDLRNDPNELVNVYQDKAYKKVIVNLKAELKRQREAYNETDANYPHLAKLIEDS